MIVDSGKTKITILKIVTLVISICVLAWILGALILGLSNKSKVVTDDSKNPNYCPNLCFDLIFLKSIILFICSSVLLIIVGILLIMGCFKKSDYMQKPEKKEVKA